MAPVEFFCLFGPAMWAAPKTFFWWRLLGALLARNTWACGFRIMTTGYDKPILLSYRGEDTGQAIQDLFLLNWEYSAVGKDLYSVH